MLGCASLAKGARAQPSGLSMTPNTCCGLGPARVSFAAGDVSTDLPSSIPQQESSVERHRTGGMTAIAVFNIIFGSLEILKGLFHAIGALVLMFELLRIGAFDIPLARVAFSLLLLATGIVGLTAGIGLLALRPWARALSLAFAGLLILSSALSFLTVPILASIGTSDVGSLSSYNLARLIVFVVLYAIFPVAYSLLLCVVFHKPAWKTGFAKG
jgi:hypothetical protein